MSTEDADLLTRIRIATEALTGLGEVFDTTGPEAEALRRAAIGAARVVPAAVGVTVAVPTSDGWVTAAWTDERCLEIDLRQHAAGRGPVLEVARSLQPVRAAAPDDGERWPEFAAAADELAVRVCRAFPLLIEVAGRAPDLVGVLSVYGKNPTAFAALDEALVRLFGAVAAQTIRSARQWQAGRDDLRTFQVALDSRAQIDQAKGILMAVHSCTAEAAFGMLIDESQRRNLKLKRVAREFLDSVAAPDGPAEFAGRSGSAELRTAGQA